MILSNIEKDERIITFDKGAIEHMKKYPKTAYSESLKIIDGLRL